VQLLLPAMSSARRLLPRNPTRSLTAVDAIPDGWMASTSARSLQPSRRLGDCKTCSGTADWRRVRQNSPPPPNVCPTPSPTSGTAAHDHRGGDSLRPREGGCVGENDHISTGAAPAWSAGGNVLPASAPSTTPDSRASLSLRAWRGVPLRLGLDPSRSCGWNPKPWARAPFSGARGRTPPRSLLALLRGSDANLRFTRLEQRSLPFEDPLGALSRSPAVRDLKISCSGSR